MDDCERARLPERYELQVARFHRQGEEIDALHRANLSLQQSHDVTLEQIMTRRPPPARRVDMLTLSCRFRPEQVAGLKELQRRTGATVAEQVRRAVDRWLASQTKSS